MESKKDNKFRKFSNIFPFALEWRITDACNLRCKYCSEYKPYLKKVDYASVVKKIAKISPKYIWIGGGEPGLVKELPDVVSALKKAINPHIGLSTNLVNTEPIIQSMRFIDDLIVSIDTMNQESSLKLRGVDPELIFSNIKRLHEYKKAKGLNVNITVNSVVCEDNLNVPGIDRLNDCLNDIDPDMAHILATVYPENNPYSISLNTELMSEYKKLIKGLRKKNRNIIENSASSMSVSSEEREDPCFCYRRFFRLQLVEDKEIFSPCAPADLVFPVCKTPCNCIRFIDSLLFVPEEADMMGSPFCGRLSVQEYEEFFSFVSKYTNPSAEERIYGLLKRERSIEK